MACVIVSPRCALSAHKHADFPAAEKTTAGTSSRRHHSASPAVSPPANLTEPSQAVPGFATVFQQSMFESTGITRAPTWSCSLMRGLVSNPTPTRHFLVNATDAEHMNRLTTGVKVFVE